MGFINKKYENSVVCIKRLQTKNNTENWLPNADGWCIKLSGYNTNTRFMRQPGINSVCHYSAPLRECKWFPEWWWYFF